MTDYPIEECRRRAEESRKRLALVGAKFTTYQKFTCEQCGQRLTIDEPDKWFESGTCDECDHVTDIRKHGCGFLAHIQ